MVAVRRRKKAAKSEMRRRKKEKNRNTRKNTKREIGSRESLKTIRDLSLTGERGSEWLHPELIINQRDETPPAITEATRTETVTATISTADRTTATVKEVTEHIKRETDRTEAGAEEEEEAMMDIINGGVAATEIAGTTTGGKGGREEVEDIIITETKVTTDEIMQIPTRSLVTTRKTRDPTITRRRTARTEILMTAGRRARLVQRMLEFVIIINLTFSNQSCVESLYAYDNSIELNEIQNNNEILVLILCH